MHKRMSPHGGVDVNYHNEIYSRVKDYSKERHKVITYCEIGKLLNEAGGK